MASIKLNSHNNIQNRYRTHLPQMGDIYLYNGDNYMWDGANFINTQDGTILQRPHTFMNVEEEQKPWRMIDELKGESTDEVIETILLLLMKNGVLKDVYEFKDILQANKLANKLEK